MKSACSLPIMFKCTFYPSKNIYSCQNLVNFFWFPFFLLLIFIFRFEYLFYLWLMGNWTLRPQYWKLLRGISQFSFLSHFSNPNDFWLVHTMFLLCPKNSSHCFPCTNPSITYIVTSFGPHAQYHEFFPFLPFASIADVVLLLFRPFLPPVTSLSGVSVIFHLPFTATHQYGALIISHLTLE